MKTIYTLHVKSVHDTKSVVFDCKPSINEVMCVIGLHICMDEYKLLINSNNVVVFLTDNPDMDTCANITIEEVNV